jgi:hypothetical protein
MYSTTLSHSKFSVFLSGSNKSNEQHAPAHKKILAVFDDFKSAIPLNAPVANIAEYSPSQLLG